MADCSIRPATREDSRAIRDLIHAVQINPTGLSWRHFLVAMAPGNKLLGCGQIKTHSDGSKELASIAVDVQVRGRGIARAIITELLAMETERPVYLMCRARLNSLYSKFGFITIMVPEMPPYFRRISQAARIFNLGSQSDNRLSIMRLD